MKTDISFQCRHIEIYTSQEILFYPYSEIMYITYDTPYSILHNTCSKVQNIKNTHSEIISLKKIMSYLPPVFVQCNQSTVINICHLIKYLHKDNLITMSDGKSFIPSRRDKSELINRIEWLKQIPCHFCMFCNHYNKNCLFEMCNILPNNTKKTPKSTE
jgi:DNA-binding LytR/AlgR family response regulator